MSRPRQAPLVTALKLALCGLTKKPNSSLCQLCVCVLMRLRLKNRLQAVRHRSGVVSMIVSVLSSLRIHQDSAHGGCLWEAMQCFRDKKPFLSRDLFFVGTQGPSGVPWQHVAGGRGEGPCRMQFRLCSASRQQFRQFGSTRLTKPFYGRRAAHGAKTPFSLSPRNKYCGPCAYLD